MKKHESTGMLIAALSLVAIILALILALSGCQKRRTMAFTDTQGRTWIIIVPPEVADMKPTPRPLIVVPEDESGIDLIDAAKGKP